MTARRAERLSAAVLAALGALSLLEALRLPDDWQGARLMPLVLGLVLLALAAAHVRAPAPAEAPAWPDAAGARRVVVLLGALGAYVLLVPVVGLLVSTVLFVLALVRALGRYGWVRSVALSASVALAAELIFRRWLSLPLP